METPHFVRRVCWLYVLRMIHRTNSICSP